MKEFMHNITYRRADSNTKSSLFKLIAVILLPPIILVATDYSSLSYNEVMTDQWEKLASKSQHIKDRALMNAISMPNPYSDQRKHIAAAIYAGASVPTVQLKTSTDAPLKLLPHAVLMQDIPLIRLLLAHDADINERGFADLPAIYFATTPAVAQELINKDAWQMLSPEEKNELLFHAMRSSFSADLINLFKKHDLNIMLIDRRGWTPLMHLAARPEQDTIAKAQALLKGLSRKQIVQFINFKAHNCGKNVFDIITTTQKMCSGHKRQELARLRLFLEQKLHQDACSICFDPLDNRTCSVVNGHTLHATCLAWARQNGVLNSSKTTIL